VNSVCSTADYGQIQELPPLTIASEHKFNEFIEPDTFTVVFATEKANLIRAIPPIQLLARVPMIGDDVNDTIIETA
jgi:hypothetical protein